MTTIIGLKAGKGKKGVVLASDLTGTIESWSQQGDVAVREQIKRNTQKIYLNQDKTAAFAMTGVLDDVSKKVLNDLRYDGDMIRNAVQNKYLECLFQANLSRGKGRIWDSQNECGMLLAERLNDEPRLWTCYPLGLVEKRDGEKFYTAIGSGSRYALEYLNSLQMMDARDIDLENGIGVVISALTRANADIYTGGLDLSVVTQDNIYEFGQEINKNAARAEERAIRRIMRRFRDKD